MPNEVLRGLLAGLTGLSIAGCSIFGGKAAEEPQYRVIESDGEIEIRHYEAFTVARTVVDAPFDDAIRRGFQRLFDYITGANRRQTDIEMTAPVLVNVDSDRADATAPIGFLPRRGTHPGSGRAPDDGGMVGWTTSFVLPPGYTRESAPIPDDSTIAIIDIDAQRVASITFSGRLRNHAAETYRQDLARWLDRRGIEHLNDWRIAGYNPPWTIPAFRRNEVLVTLQ
ncbi:MAG: heme-binding protein [Thiotrichales bacterium]|nr:heme-binding protein [Thiotrichales bacterium]